MPRKPRPLERSSGIERDARLLVIASEDTHAVQLYFSRFSPRRVQFRILPTEEGRSSPKALTDRLDRFRDEFQIDDDDQLWYCGDLDHWAAPSHIGTLTEVLQHCRNCSYQVAISNPCFELWLLLHFSDVPTNVGNCDSVAKQLSMMADGYSKLRGCGIEVTTEMVRTAIARAEQLDVGVGDIPVGSPSTRIYRILKVLLERESIILRKTS